jgi:integrase
VKIEASEDSFNPALALNAWLAIAPSGDGESPLFCSLHGSKTGKALLPAAIATIIQRRCAVAGVLGDFSGHSLRRGWIQSANQEGISVPDIQQITRQKTPTMVTIYCENNDKRKLARRLRDGL